MLTIRRLMSKYVPGMLTCKEIDSFLYDFHENQLSYIECLKFKLHLSMCKECKNYVRKYENIIRISQAEFTNAEPAKKVPEELIKAILKSRTKK
ncbi:zf-HC2 domain-containing protein [Colwellia sp. 6_MG-2023]|uniref:zf-HC2 domain-containing protein n=1 Tax=Colwellia sp. 6_MG-2023 TaxID=3062676 RepID=UPI0026E1B37C|nr:zf-HC2 domain-containing protein [Colwellia sp. 6_MG-2023]MDO6489079.1 zf-HC2 domain-containing protein [Colwellia sp. 6_MG-2023]